MTPYERLVYCRDCYDHLLSLKDDPRLTPRQKRVVRNLIRSFKAALTLRARIFWSSPVPPPKQAGAAR
jgi:hypothetical protein